MIVQANEFKDNVPDPVLPSVDSERDFSYVQSEVHFNTVEFDHIPATDLNTSNESIDSYMRDIGDSHSSHLSNLAYHSTHLVVHTILSPSQIYVNAKCQEEHEVQSVIKHSPVTINL